MKTSMRILTLWALVCVLIALGGYAQEQKKPSPYDPIEENPDLPRVLIIGDSISIGYTLDVRANLAGKANVLRISTNGGPTTKGLENIEAWLGEKPWDVIHFNWGLHDLKYVAPETGEQPNIKGKPQVPVADYAQNLDKLVERMKKTGAKLVWATTTPVPQGAAGRVPGDEMIYNAAALKVMQKHGVAVNDLYTYILPDLAQYQLPANVHFTPEGSAHLGRKVADVILDTFAKK